MAGKRQRYSSSGFITLHAANGVSVACKRYNDITRRKEIIKQWIRSYPNKSEMYIQISPDIDEELDELYLKANFKINKKPRQLST